MKNPAKYKKINSLADLREYKAYLQAKADKKEKKIIKKAERLKESVTPKNILYEALHALNVNSAIIDYLPLVLEYGKPVLGMIKKISFKKVLLPLIGGIGASLLAFNLFGKKDEQNNDEE